MILLGECPKCKAEDSIFISGQQRTNCRRCRGKFGSWSELAFGDRREGRFIPVFVGVTKHSVELDLFNRIKIEETGHHLRIIIDLLYVSMEIRLKAGIFDLSGTINLRDCFYRKIGLFDHCFLLKNPICQNLLCWYGKLLSGLFQKELIFKGVSFGRGRILKLLPRDPLSQKRLKYYFGLSS